MKKSLALIAGLALASSAQAGALTYTFDISGLGSEGGFGTNFPTLTHDFGAPGVIVGVEFNVNATPNSPSWSSEIQIAIDTWDDASLDADIDFAEWGGADNSDPIAISGAFGANSASSDGMVYLTIWETWSDSPVPDAVFGSNSTVTVIYRAVPAPGAAALLGLGGLVAVRRRR